MQYSSSWILLLALMEYRVILDSLNNVNSSMHKKAEAPDISMPNSMPLASSETCAIMSKIVRKPEESCDAGYSGHLDSDAFKSVNVLDSVTAAERPNVSSEGSAETTQLSSVIQNFQKQEPNYSHRAAKFSNQSDIPGKSPPLGDSSMTSTGSDVRQKIASPGNILSVINTRKVDRQVQCEIAYMNHYSFAQTASSVAEELMPKSSNEIKEEVIKSEEEVISTQMKTILKKSDKFCWPNIQNLNVDTQKERCGWCFSCKVPTDDIDCLFNMNNGNVLGSLKSEVVGLQSKRNKKGHLVDIICHILSIEDRLCGLLVGPWLNPHYTKLWRKNALKAADLASVKHLLLMLESNLHHLAVSAEWLKHVDSLATLGSASHIVIASSRASKQGIGRKKARFLDPEGNPSSNGAGGLSLCWWRGGRVSCQLFSWKVLPRSLVSKAARQAGCAKIPGILYPESSDFSKRSRNVAWRAAVESSTTVEQLAVQVREFDMNIRWDDIENTHPLSIMDKEFKKSSRLFKKAIIRRKCLKEGEGIKYLIDFGKRRNVPDIVVKHGSMVEESSSGRKRYWLKESYVPLHLLKSFEERRIAPEKSEYYQCGHCNKDVLIREAVCCQFCKGFFHKRHIRKSAGTVTAECTYTCYRCQDGRFMKPGKKAAKTGTKKGKVNTRSVKVQSQKSKKATTDCKSVQLKSHKKPVGRRPLRSKNDKQIASVPLRRSTRKIKFVSVPIKKRVGRKKGKQKTKKKISRKPKKDPSWRKQRTQAYYSYWLNGLLLSRKPDDERVMLFRKKFFFDSSENLTDVLDKPKCYLCCDAGYTSTSNFIACEICGGNVFSMFLSRYF
ncbi:hypothetical protein Patl1_29478 [Pistacia atlantica]|uniref:Uncharacterized protein n=1 Tax=Pistacia atlantica TaxID=434234 RepID=A0ACC1ABZ0_9ROSI|nr:hypothetical protein Patl1_29478 [Pistacia atlantica]